MDSCIPTEKERTCSNFFHVHYQFSGAFRQFRKIDFISTNRCRWLCIYISSYYSINKYLYYPSEKPTRAYRCVCPPAKKLLKTTISWAYNVSDKMWTKRRLTVRFCQRVNLASAKILQAKYFICVSSYLAPMRFDWLWNQHISVDWTFIVKNYSVFTKETCNSGFNFRLGLIRNSTVFDNPTKDLQTRISVKKKIRKPCNAHSMKKRRCFCIVYRNMQVKIFLVNLSNFIFLKNRYNQLYTLYLALCIF